MKIGFDVSRMKIPFEVAKSSYNDAKQNSTDLVAFLLTSPFLLVLFVLMIVDSFLHSFYIKK